MNQLLNEQHR